MPKAKFKIRKFRKAAGVSDHTINRALEPDSNVSDRDLMRMRNGTARLWAQDAARTVDDAATLAGLRDRASAISVTALALELGVDASNLAKVLTGARRIGVQLRQAIGAGK